MSFWRHYYHIVWATKARKPLITAQIEARLHGYLVSRAGELDAHVYAINGVADHVHVVASIPPKHAVSDFVKALKGASAHFVNHVIRPDEQFAWQRGFGSFTLGESKLVFAMRYVDEQKTRHVNQDLNAWLEKMAEFDEGPDGTDLRTSTAIREDSPTYDTPGDSPF